jgi:hypothetical protein
VQLARDASPGRNLTIAPGPDWWRNGPSRANKLSGRAVIRRLLVFVTKLFKGRRVRQQRDPLAGCRAKLDRGHEHAAALRGEVTKYFNRRPYTFFVDSNRDGTIQELKVKINTQPDLLRWAVIIGDCLHNFRGALDHLIYAIAISASGSEPPPDSSVLQFPIASAPDRFQARRLGRMEADEHIRTAVEALQPYGERTGDGRSLALLAQLNNADKHRLLLILTVARSDADHLVSGLNPGQEYTMEPGLGPIVDGAMLLRLTTSSHSPRIEVNTRGAVAVAIGHSADIPGNVLMSGVNASDLFSLLDGIERECRHIVAELEALTR